MRWRTPGKLVLDDLGVFVDVDMHPVTYAYSPSGELVWRQQDFLRASGPGGSRRRT